MNNLTEELYNRLMKGESAEDIAADLTNAINAAMEKQKEAEKTSAKESDAALIIEAFKGFIDKYYPNTILSEDKAWDDFTAKDLITLFDAFVKIGDSLSDLSVLTDFLNTKNDIKTFDDAIGKGEVTINKAPDISNDRDDEILDKWLKDLKNLF